MTEKFVKKILDLIERNFHILALLVLAVAGFNYFYHLGAERVWDWDESLDGATAYEMLQNHNFVVSTYAHQVMDSDYAYRIGVWNFKPPLGWWAIILDYKIFGFNVFALRFYSGFFCLLTLLAVMWVMAKEIGKVPAFFSGSMLATTSPVVFIHGARSGDLSSFFTFLILLFMICLLMAEKKASYLYWAGLVFSLSFLVYSFASFQLVVLALVYLLITGDYKKFSVKNYLLSILCAVLPIGTWVVWRLCNVQGWGFFKGMISYDLIKRSTQSLEGHSEGLDYYVVAMAKGDPYWFTFTMVVVFCSLAAIGLKIDRKNRLLVLSGLGVLVPLILFSLAKTKLGWYMLPARAPFTIAAGCLVWTLFNDRRCQAAAKVAVLVLFLVAGLRSEREIRKQIKNPAQETSQDLLNEFKNTSYPPNSTIYAKNMTHAPFFVAEVVCGLNPVSIKQLSECLGHDGFLMVVKDKQNPEGLDFVAAHHLAMVLQNDDWMIVKL